MHPEQHKDPHAAALGRRGGQKRMERLSAQERSTLSKHALRARWHRRQFNEEQERAREITYTVIQQATTTYLVQRKKCYFMEFYPG